jgi:hypothetical protein
MCALTRQMSVYSLSVFEVKKEILDNLVAP